MKFNKESRILAAIALMCITVFLFGFTKKEDVGNKYQIEVTYKNGRAFYVLVDGNGYPIDFIN